MQRRRRLIYFSASACIWHRSFSCGRKIWRRPCLASPIVLVVHRLWRPRSNDNCVIRSLKSLLDSTRFKSSLRRLSRALCVQRFRPELQLLNPLAHPLFAHFREGSFHTKANRPVDFQGILRAARKNEHFCSRFHVADAFVTRSEGDHRSRRS